MKARTYWLPHQLVAPVSVAQSQETVVVTFTDQVRDANRRSLSADLRLFAQRMLFSDATTLATAQSRLRVPSNMRLIR